MLAHYGQQSQMGLNATGNGPIHRDGLLIKKYLLFVLNIDAYNFILNLLSIIDFHLKLAIIYFILFRKIKFKNIFSIFLKS